MRKFASGFVAGMSVLAAVWAVASITQADAPRSSHLTTAGIGCDNFGGARLITLTDGKGSIDYSLVDEKDRAACTKALSAMWRRHGAPGCWTGNSTDDVSITWPGGPPSSCYGDRFSRTPLPLEANSSRGYRA